MELERLLAVMKRRWWLVAAVTLFGALIGTLAESSRTDRFTATATVQLAPNRDVYGSETVLNRLAINEMATISTAALRVSLVDSLGEAGVGLDPDADLSIQQVPDTDLVNISVSGPDEDTLIQAANLWADTYVNLTRAQERAELQDHLDQVTLELNEARAERLALDSDLAALVVQRETQIVATYNEALLRDPELWDAIVKLDQDIDALTTERTAAEVALANVLDSSIAATARGPLEAVRTGNGLGPTQGALIGLIVALMFITSMAARTASLRAISNISSAPVWPTSVRLARSRLTSPWRRRSAARNLTAVSTQVLNRLPDTKLQVVSFAGVDRNRTHGLKSALAQDLESRGYSVSMMGDDIASANSRSVDGLLDLLNAENSVVFADIEELRSKRFGGRITSVVAVDEHRDQQDLVARQIADSLHISDSVLTVVSR